MAVRGEEVSSSIDAHVREALERMVGEIRSSVEDVRAAVDSQLNAALQSMQADVKSLSFLPHIQRTIGELEESYVAAQPAPVAPSASDASRLKRAIMAVERGRSQVDLLNSFLEQCLEFGSRAALLILRGNSFGGWKGVGFGIHGGNDEMIKRFNATPGLVPELDRVLSHEQVVAWDGESLASRFAGATPPVDAVLIPMVIKDRIAAAVYVDVVEADRSRFDVSALEILVFTTGLLIDTLSLRKKVPSPSLNEASDSNVALASVAPAAPAPAATPTPAASASLTPASSPPASSPAAAPGGGDATVAISAAQLREMMAAPSATPTFTMPDANEFASPPPPPVPPPAAPPAAAPPPPPLAAGALGGGSPASADETNRPSTQYVPPVGVGRNALFGGSQSEDAKKHDEARRFARLLVSEIKLYNEAKVEQGRKNRDLYERLKEDIDRSRQMYDERIADDVRKSSNYFYDELVRILADNRPESLGL